MSPYHESIKLLFALHREQTTNGRATGDDNTPKAEEISCKLDNLWVQLTDEQRYAVGFISEMLLQQEDEKKLHDMKG